MEGSGAGSVLVTNGSGCGSGRPKNKRIRIPNTDSQYRYRATVPTSFKDLEFALKGIDRSFRGGVKSSLIRTLFINWRLGNFFLLILKGFHFHHKISKKPIDAA